MRISLLSFLALLSSCANEPEAEPANPLVGAWQLEQFVDTPDGGVPVHEFGNPPVGLFVFSADGHFSVSLMRNPPPTEEEEAEGGACTPLWYCSYFGTYTYNPGGPSWTTSVTGGNIAGYLGTDQTRTFELQGDVLTITEDYEIDGQKFRGVRVLRRAGS